MPEIEKPVSEIVKPMPVFITEHRFKPDAGNWKTGVGNCKTYTGNTWLNFDRYFKP